MSAAPSPVDLSNVGGAPVSGIDLAMLAWLVVSIVVGIVRGLVFELVSLIGWGVAFFGSFWLAPLLAPLLPIGDAGSVMNETASFLMAFVAILIAWGLAARLLRLMLHATPLRAPDRILGAGFGLARGVIVLLLVAVVAELTPLESSAAWRHSRVAPWLNVALQELQPILPPKIARHLPAAA